MARMMLTPCDAILASGVPIVVVITQLLFVRCSFGVSSLSRPWLSLSPAGLWCGVENGILWTTFRASAGYPQPRKFGLEFLPTPPTLARMFDHLPPSPAHPAGAPAPPVAAAAATGPSGDHAAVRRFGPFNAHRLLSEKDNGHPKRFPLGLPTSGGRVLPVILGATRRGCRRTERSPQSRQWARRRTGRSLARASPLRRSSWQRPPTPRHRNSSRAVARRRR